MESIEERKLIEFINKHKIGNYSPVKNSKEVNLEFSEDDLKWLISQGLVKDATFGGLVKGLIKNYEGSIYLLWPCANGKLYYRGFVYPGFYISSTLSYKSYKKEFSDLESSIDNFLTGNIDEVSIPENCKIIDTQNKPIMFLCLNPEAQFVFAKTTVINHLEKIVKLDNSVPNI